jgi:hypothetical protein
VTPHADIATRSFPHRNAAIRAGRLRGPRALTALEKHTAIAAAFVDAGKAELLAGPPWRKAAIREFIVENRQTFGRFLPRRRVVPGALTHDMFGTSNAAESLAAAFIWYLQNGRQP